jgi:hypothetical protein
MRDAMEAERGVATQALARISSRQGQGNPSVLRAASAGQLSEAEMARMAAAIERKAAQDYPVLDPDEVRTLFRERRRRPEAEPETADIRFSASRIGSEIWDYPEQKISSAATSINETKLPETFKRVAFVPGSINADIGGGRFDNATAKLAESNVQNVIYDPFNRTREWNKNAIAKIANGKSDTATVNNVLNVIQEPASRQRVIAQAADAVRQDGKAYFLIYEGDQSGNSRVTKQKDGVALSWQEHRKADSYIPEVQQHFRNVQRSGNLLVATDPIKQESAQGGVRFSPRSPAAVRRAAEDAQARANIEEILVNAAQKAFKRPIEDAQARANIQEILANAGKKAFKREIENAQARENIQEILANAAQKAFKRPIENAQARANLQEVLRAVAEKAAKQPKREPVVIDVPKTEIPKIEPPVEPIVTPAEEPRLPSNMIIARAPRGMFKLYSLTQQGKAVQEALSESYGDALQKAQRKYFLKNKPKEDQAFLKSQRYAP